MKKLPFLASILALLGVMILSALGLWQIQRLHWKQDLLHDIEQAWQAPPELLNAAQILSAQTQGKKFLHGHVRGTYLNEASIRITPRVLNEQQGAHVVTPLVLEDHSILLVNRGWVPLSQDTNNMIIAKPVTVSGVLRFPDQTNFFTPVNDPVKNQWYTINPGEIAKAYDLKGILPYVLVAEKNGDIANGTEFPVPVGAKPELNNNHLSYAFFWFAMAGVLIAVFMLRFMLVKE